MSTLAATAQALALMGSAALTLGAAAVAVAAFLFGRRPWARGAAIAAVAVPGAYVNILLVDSAGHAWVPSARRDLDATPLFAELRPGDQRRAELTFRVAPGVPLRGLLVESDDAIARLLIGHERSPLYGKVVFALPSV